MPKRFIDTEIWDRQEFNSAPEKIKLLTLFITCKCDSIGIFKVAPMLINAFIGSNVTEAEILSIPLKIEKLKNGSFWLTDFCFFQYGELTEKCKPHNSYIKLLKANGLFLRVSKGYAKGINTLQEKEKEINKEEEKEKGNENVNEIVNYLNEKLQTNYKSKTESTIKLINARIKEGYSVKEILSVIDKKCSEWMGTPHAKYLRPETLFSNKFESYVNQIVVKESIPQNINPAIARQQERNRLAQLEADNEFT